MIAKTTLVAHFDIDEFWDTARRAIDIMQESGLTVEVQYSSAGAGSAVVHSAYIIGRKPNVD